MPALSWSQGLGFLAVLLLMSSLFHFPVILDQPIDGIHQWRQSDCWSMTLNYYHEDRSLLDPRMHYEGHGEEDGFAEFPLIYYLDAQLMKVFGSSIAIPRITNILILFAGLFSLFLALRRLFRSSFWGAWPPFLVFSSPILIYYGSSPMLNVVALSFLMIAFYFSFRFYEERSDRLLIGAAAFIALAGLMRTTMAIAAAPLYVLFLVELLGGRTYGPDGGAFFARKFKQGAILFGPVLLIGAWSAFAKAWNTAEGHEYFFLETNSVFRSASVAEFWEVATRLYHEYLQEAFTRPFLLLFAILFPVILIRPRSFSRIGVLAVATYGFFTLLYFLLWYRNLFQHDYYLFDTYPFALSMPIVLLHALSERTWVLRSRAAMIGASLLLLFGIYGGSVLQGKRYGIGGSLVNRNFILSESEKDFWEWFHHANRHHEALYDITPHLRDLGIERKDPVISLPDPTPNHTLSLMDQYGFTGLFDKGNKGKELIEMWMEQGAEYLIVNDPQYLEEHELDPYTEQLIGTHKEVRIYRLPEDP
jgi:hypothetical protein